MKIYVCGFSHVGTTILRKVIGDHSLVEEVTHETHIPPDYGEAPHIVFKSGGLPKPMHSECKNIVMIKNPWDVMGSMSARFNGTHIDKLATTFQTYLNYIEYFIKPSPSHKVRYEDLFTGGLEGVFDYLGLEYEGPKDRQSEFSLLDYENQQEALRDFAAYRTRQINMPFQNMTGNSAPHLSKELLALIETSPLIPKVYGDYKYLANYIKK